jgi:hypothetical protein
MFLTARFSDQLFLRLGMYHFGYLWQSIQHLVLYFRCDRMPLANSEIAVYHDVQIEIKTESHFANVALAKPRTPGTRPAIALTCVSMFASGVMSANSRTAGRSCFQALYRITSAAQRAAHPSAASHPGPRSHGRVHAWADRAPSDSIVRRNGTCGRDRRSHRPFSARAMGYRELLASA